VVTEKVLVLVVAIFGPLIATTPSAAPTLDQSSTAISNQFFLCCGGESAQTLTVGVTGVLTGVEVYLAHDSTAPTLDQSSTAGDRHCKLCCGFEWAQTWTVGKTGVLTGVEVYLGDSFGGFSSPGPLSYSVRRAVGGVPSASPADILASGSLSRSTFAGQAFYALDLGTVPIPVVAGDQLAIVLTNSDADSFAPWTWRGGSLNAGGIGLFRPNSSAAWTSLDPLFDLAFRTFVDPVGVSAIGPLSYSVRRVVGGMPSASPTDILAYGSVQGSAFTGPAFYVLDLGTVPIPVVAGDQLAIVLSSSDPDSATQWTWRGSQGSFYPGGLGLSRPSSTAAWAPDPNSDRAFRTFVDRAFPVPTMPEWVLGVLMLLLGLIVVVMMRPGRSAVSAAHSSGV
jgi:hypothetical protein